MDLITFVAPEPADAASPCVNVCALDAATGWCAGCGRTMDEITAWPGARVEDRRAIRAAARERLAGQSTL